MRKKESNNSLLIYCVSCPEYHQGEGSNECFTCKHINEVTKPERKECEPLLSFRDDIDTFASTENGMVYGNERNSIALSLQEYCSDKLENITNATIFLQYFILGITIAKIAYICKVSDLTIKRRLQEVTNFLKERLTKDFV